MEPGRVSVVAPSPGLPGSMMPTRAKSWSRLEGQRSGARRAVGTGWRWQRRRVVGSAVLLAVLAVLASGCEPSDPHRLAAERGRASGFAGADSASADVGDEALDADGSQPRTEPDIPLPPGWAEELAHLRRREAAARRTSADPLAELIKDSPDGIELPSRRRDGGDAEGLSGGYGSYDDPGPGGGGLRPGLRRQPGGRPLVPPPSRPTGSNYAAMAVVFLIPVAVLIPTLWIWHVVRTLRTATGPQIGPVSPRRVD